MFFVGSNSAHQGKIPLKFDENLLSGIGGCHLTHLSPMNFPISISRTSLFQILGMLDGIFHLYSNSNGTCCEPTVETLIRSCILRLLFWVRAVCLCPTIKTLGLYGLNQVAGDSQRKM